MLFNLSSLFVLEKYVWEVIVVEFINNFYNQSMVQTAKWFGVIEIRLETER